MRWTGTRRAARDDHGRTARAPTLSSSFNQGAWVSLPDQRRRRGNGHDHGRPHAGANAVLSGIFLGEAGAPPAPDSRPALPGSWVGAVGSAGYDLAGWDGATGDVSYLPNAVAEPRAGQPLSVGREHHRPARTAEPGRHDAQRRAPTTTPTRSSCTLSFKEAYAATCISTPWTGTPPAGGRSITVNGQTAGALERIQPRRLGVASRSRVAAGGTVTITVDRTAGSNAVLSGIFLGEAGHSPGPTVSSAPQGAGSAPSARRAMTSAAGTARATSPRCRMQR